MSIDTHDRTPIPKSLYSDDVWEDREEAITQRRWVPGEPGIWALIFTDLTVFTIYFIDVMYQWGDSRQAFAAGHKEISLTSGILNTFFLLTASLCVALGVQKLRHGHVQLTSRLFLGAGVAGAAFVINKYIEWSGEVHDGHTPQSSLFFQLYFILTGIHLFHVLIAMTLLLFMRRRVSKVVGTPTPHQSRFIENCAIYWHMVDLLWLGILALFYLMR
ncbi:cytochrome c oxidase subunit 3 [Nocardia miyunensis]|uniref:cytochrome c oxidase subunit 3 n=1 Tax=Nocardia miyunensis TaxID=282684 RepID=UPI0009FC061A|nr:cytochrome c oxidase subunit 3 [Nocardia miyunensis]